MAGQFELALRGFIDDVEATADRVVVKSVLEVQSRIKIRTPVDTGRLRANWQYGLDAPPGGELALGSTLTATPGALGGFGHVHYLVNNLPYARRIEFGFRGTDSLGRTYNQSGRMMVGLTVMEWPSIVAAAVASEQTK